MSTATKAEAAATKSMVVKERSLEAIAKELRDHQQQTLSIFQKAAAEHLRAMGVLLVEVKLRVGHGNFLPWVEKNTGFSPQWVADLMRGAENWDKIKPQISAGVSFSRATRALLTPRKDTHNGARRTSKTTLKRTGDAMFGTPGQGVARPVPTVVGDQTENVRDVGTAHIANRSLTFKWDGLPAGERDEQVFLTLGADYAAVEIHFALADLTLK